MLITIAPEVRLFVDVEGPAFVPDGPQPREKPTLILLHGGPGSDHSGFKPAFSRLADVAQIVSYDHRGHGRSSRRPANEWTLDTFADDIVRLCDALGIVKPVVLGQSFGGFVAQRYLARHPDHPARVVLSSTSPHMGLARKLAMFEQLGGPEESLINTLRPGDFAHELGFLDGSSRYASLVAAEPSRVLTLKRQDLESLVQSNPLVLYRVMCAIVRTVHRIQTRLAVQSSELTNYIVKQHGRY